MKLTLNDLLASQQPLQRIVTKEVPARLAFRLARIIRQINTELQDYDTARKMLLERLGTASEDGTQYHIETEQQEEFGEEMQALLDTEVELDVAQVAESDLPDLTIADAMALWWLVEMEKPARGR